MDDAIDRFIGFGQTAITTRASTHVASPRRPSAPVLFLLVLIAWLLAVSAATAQISDDEYWSNPANPRGVPVCVLDYSLLDFDAHERWGTRAMDLVRRRVDWYVENGEHFDVDTIEQVAPSCTTVVYVNLLHVRWREGDLNARYAYGLEHEELYSHASDPARASVFQTAAGIEIHWQKDQRDILLRNLGTHADPDANPGLIHRYRVERGLHGSDEWDEVPGNGNDYSSDPSPVLVDTAALVDGTTYDYRIRTLRPHEYGAPETDSAYSEVYSVLYSASFGSSGLVVPQLWVERLGLVRNDVDSISPPCPKTTGGGRPRAPWRSRWGVSIRISSFPHRSGRTWSCRGAWRRPKTAR